MKRKNKMVLMIPFIIVLMGIGGISAYKESGQSDPGLKFAISYPSDVNSGPITGRVYVIFSKQKGREPRFQVHPHGVPFFGLDIIRLNPGESAIIDKDTFGYPLKNVADIPPGDYFVQGFVNIYTEFKRSDGHTLWMHKDQWEGQRWYRSPGNLHSDVRKVHIDPSEYETIKLSCKNVIPPVEVPPDTKWVKRIKFQSKILSEVLGPDYVFRSHYSSA